MFTQDFLKKEDKEIQKTSLVDSIPPKFHISFRGGAGIAYVIGDIGSNSYQERKGTIFGMALKYDLSKFLMLETELMYERKGYKLNDQSGSYFYYTSLGPKNVNTLIDLDYLEIPLLLRFETGNKVKFFLHTGPYVAFLISGRVTGISEWENRSDYGYYHNKTTVYDRIDGNLQNRDLGITTGGGVRFPIYKNLMFELECRYNAGMKNILEDEPYQTGDVDRLLKINLFY
ncbi:MAG: PorT family protein [Bacteroidales bacterium]|nr:PorT family protein [Bacteroidales bacterium]